MLGALGMALVFLWPGAADADRDAEPAAAGAAPHQGDALVVMTYNVKLRAQGSHQGARRALSGVAGHPDHAARQGAGAELHLRPRVMDGGSDHLPVLATLRIASQSQRRDPADQ